MKLVQGNALYELQKMKKNSVDSIVTDPPYAIGFMGKSWDKKLPFDGIWKECIRVLKPGGYIVAMGASRTYHRLAVQLEDLGMICHPMIGWIYGSGFPKATDLSKLFDKRAGVDRKVVGTSENSRDRSNHVVNSEMGAGDKEIKETKPSTDLAKKWDGYKYGLQALKPALEPIAVFQKPWQNDYVDCMTKNIVKHGVGAFNIDACRVETNEKIPSKKCIGDKYAAFKGNKQGENLPWEYSGKGRHPANLLHDGSEVVEKVFLEQGGELRARGNKTKKDNGGNYNSSSYEFGGLESGLASDSGSASRFFNKLPITDIDAPFLYCAKASKAERNNGLEDMQERKSGSFDGNIDLNNARKIGAKPDKPNMQQQNNHPTVKPIALMEWLIKLVTPEGGITVDPFMGSGTTGIAALKNGFDFIGMEKEIDSFKIAKMRIENYV